MTRTRLAVLIVSIIALVLSIAPPTASARRQAAATAQATAPVFSFPTNETSYPSNGPYLF